MKLEVEDLLCMLGFFSLVKEIEQFYSRFTISHSRIDIFRLSRRIAQLCERIIMQLVENSPFFPPIRR